MDTFTIIYLTCAAVGGIIFCINLLMSFFGVDGCEDGCGGDSDASFSVLSLQAISSFLLMFGLMGMATLKAGVPVELTLVAAILWGVVAVWIIARILGSLLSLQSSGTVEIANAIGEEGSVYLRIPAAGGSGQVQVTVQKRLRTYDAISEDNVEIPSGTRVTVVRVAGAGAVSVRKA